MDFAIETTGLCKSYGSFHAVKDCSISVTKGSIYGLLGANGAGKTTIFKMLCGLIYPTEGRAKVLGLDILAKLTEIQGNIGTMIDTPVFYENLSGANNLKLHLAYMNKTANVEDVLQAVGLEFTDKRPVSKYSLGMRQRLAIARAIVHKPKLLILDEPTNGLDPAAIVQMRELFVKLSKESGITILISSHILAEIGHICDVIGMIKKGKILCENTISEIEKQHGNLEKYYMEVMESDN